MTHPSRTLPASFLVGIAPAFILALGAISMPASAQSDPSATPSEQEQIEAAKRHPIAQPEPRPLYPAQKPAPRPERGLPAQAPPPREPREPRAPAQAPAPRAPGPRPPAPPDDYAYQQRRDAPDAEGVEMDGDVDVGSEESPVVVSDVPPPPRAERMVPAPAPGYVWAPGYWYWYNNDYVWISGGWIPPRPGYVYVGSRWVHTYDGWVFTSGGWSTGGDVVVYPVYRHQYLWGGSRAYGYGYGRPGYYRSPGYRRDAPRAYVAPRRDGGYRRDAPRGSSRAHPVYVHPRR